MTKNLEITASEMNVYPVDTGSFNVDLTVSQDEYSRVIDNYPLDEVIDYCGADDLLEAMDTDKIVSYLRECGYKVEEEEA